MKNNKIEKYINGNFVLTEKKKYALQKLEKIKNYLYNNFKNNQYGGANKNKIKRSVPNSIIEQNKIIQDINNLPIKITEEGTSFLTNDQMKKLTKNITDALKLMPSNDILIHENDKVFTDLMIADENLSNAFEEYKDVNSGILSQLDKPEETQITLLKIQKSLLHMQMKMIFSKLKLIKKADITPLLEAFEQKFTAMNAYMDAQNEKFTNGKLVDEKDESPTKNKKDESPIKNNKDESPTKNDDSDDNNSTSSKISSKTNNSDNSDNDKNNDKNNDKDNDKDNDNYKNFYNYILKTFLDSDPKNSINEISTINNLKLIRKYLKENNLKIYNMNKNLSYSEVLLKYNPSENYNPEEDTDENEKDIDKNEEDTDENKEESDKNNDDYEDDFDEDEDEDDDNDNVKVYNIKEQQDIIDNFNNYLKNTLNIESYDEQKKITDEHLKLINSFLEKNNIKLSLENKNNLTYGDVSLAINNTIGYSYSNNF